VVTTNYDTLFEEASAAAGWPVDVLPYGQAGEGRRWRPSRLFGLDELRARVLDGREHQGAVQEVVVLLARRVGDQHAAVAGGPVQGLALVLTLRLGRSLALPQPTPHES
jgi:hypothetical protein